MSWIVAAYAVAVLAVSACAQGDAPLAASSGKATQAWRLLKESLQDQAPLLTSMRAEERKAKSSNLRASKSEGKQEEDSDEAADGDTWAMLDEAEDAAAEAASLAAQDGAAADAAAQGIKDTRPVNDTASEFERDVSELILGLGKGGFGATPMGSSVKRMKKLITGVMLKQVRQAHHNDQRTLDRLADAVGSCGGTKKTALGQASQKESIYRGKSPLHKSCRTVEASYATEKQACETGRKQALTMKRLTCKTFDEVEKSVASQVVASQLIKKAAAEGSETYVRRLTATVCGVGGDGTGGSGQGGYLDRFLSAKQECEKRTQDYEDKKKQCKKMEEKYTAKKMECDSLQAQMDNAACNWAVGVKDACENYVGCYSSKKASFMTMVKVVKKNEKDRKAEFRGLKRMQCLINAFGDGKVTAGEVDNCKKQSHETYELDIMYPHLDDLESCTVPKTYPATPAYKREEFAMLPALARGQADANECTGVEEVATSPAPYSPKECKCERIALMGVYSAGPLIKCTNCLDVYRSTQRNSCPRGTKIFSPRGPQDWQVVMDSGGALNDPFWIVDVTRPKAGRTSDLGTAGLNSKNHYIDDLGWENSDDSSWWITRRGGGLKTRKGSDGSYQPNCFLNIADASNVNKISFNAEACAFHSRSYYCQPKRVSTRPKRGSPSTCRCQEIALTGKYSAGALIKCENCWETSKSRDKNSCPKGTKIFSPSSREDWKVILESAGPLRNPSWIVDVTRPQSSCGGCTGSAMESTNARQATWRTADGSPWWLRSSKYSEPNGDYTANCYLGITGTPQNENDIRFNDKGCDHSSSSYYCQPARQPDH